MSTMLSPRSYPGSFEMPDVHSERVRRGGGLFRLLRLPRAGYEVHQGVYARKIIDCFATYYITGDCLVLRDDKCGAK